MVHIILQDGVRDEYVNIDTSSNGSLVITTGHKRIATRTGNVITLRGAHSNQPTTDGLPFSTSVLVNLIVNGQRIASVSKSSLLETKGRTLHHFPDLYDSVSSIKIHDASRVFLPDWHCSETGLTFVVDGMGYLRIGHDTPLILEKVTCTVHGAGQIDLGGVEVQNAIFKVYGPGEITNFMGLRSVQASVHGVGQVVGNLGPRALVERQQHGLGLITLTSTTERKRTLRPRSVSPTRSRRLQRSRSRSMSPLQLPPVASSVQRLALRNPSQVALLDVIAADKDEAVCVVCKDHKSRVMSLECSHVTLCFACVEHYRHPGATCVACRKAVETWQVTSIV